MNGVLVTGAAGYIGRKLLPKLREAPGIGPIAAADIREIPPEDRIPGIEYIQRDIRDPAIAEDIARHHAARVVHLASVVTPTPGMSRETLFDIDVRGTRNLLDACLAQNVQQLVVASSGAAYGYHASNPELLHEDMPLRGNPEFAYADHKRQVEETLAECRDAHPGLRQLIFRPGTILGEGTQNQITALFDKPVVLGVAGAPIPFVFIWDEDVVACILKGLLEDREGIYNLAGDGALRLAEIARIIGKPYLPLPAPLLKTALWILRALRATQYGPEQVDFLRYRPVLANHRLGSEFGYIPRKTSAETLAYFLDARNPK